MNKCSYADRYQATRKPSCNNGNGCQVCNEKWEGGLSRRKVIFNAKMERLRKAFIRAGKGMRNL